MTARTTLGFLYPGHAAEDDYSLMQELLGPTVALSLVHTSVGEDAHRVAALLDLGSPDRLVEGASRLRPFNVDSVVWACTSGSFVFGWEGAQQQPDVISGSLACRPRARRWHSCQLPGPSALPGWPSRQPTLMTLRPISSNFLAHTGLGALFRVEASRVGG
jgi:hypothetical protein